MKVFFLWYFFNPIEDLIEATNKLEIASRQALRQKADRTEFLWEVIVDGKRQNNIPPPKHKDDAALSRNVKSPSLLLVSLAIQSILFLIELFSPQTLTI